MSDIALMSMQGHPMRRLHIVVRLPASRHDLAFVRINFDWILQRHVTRAGAESVLVEVHISVVASSVTETSLRALHPSQT
jgi:hypothetical protein